MKLPTPGPQNFHGAPGLSGYQPGATPISRTEEPRMPYASDRECLIITLYRSGLANLNGEASRLLGKGHETISLFPPAGPRRYWVLRQGSDELPGEAKLLGRTDRTGHLRFRSIALGVALFAALPETQVSLRLLLKPLGTGWELVAQ